MKLDNFIHGNIAGHTTAMNIITGSINIIIPALMRRTPTHHECGNPYDRQSSRTNFNATATLYIRVTQNLKRRMETASPYEGHTSRTFFACATPWFYFRVTPPYIRVTQNTTTTMSNPSDDVRLMGSTIRMT